MQQLGFKPKLYRPGSFWRTLHRLSYRAAAGSTSMREMFDGMMLDGESEVPRTGDFQRSSCSTRLTAGWAGLLSHLWQEREREWERERERERERGREGVREREREGVRSEWERLRKAEKGWESNCWKNIFASVCFHFVYYVSFDGQGLNFLAIMTLMDSNIASHSTFFPVVRKTDENLSLKSNFSSTESKSPCLLFAASKY